MNNTLYDMEGILDHQICGFHQYVLTPTVHLNYISRSLCEMLGVFPDELLDDDTDLYVERVHPGDLEKYSGFIHQAASAEQPLTCDYRLVKKDGTVIWIRDTITPGRLENGTLIGHSVLTDITDLKNTNTNESRRYLKALTDVYDKIFEFNLDANTVKCLHSEDASYFKRFENIAMQTDDALEQWLIASVNEDQQKPVRQFFKSFCQKRAGEADGRPPQIIYNALATDNTVKKYTGVFIKVDESISFYCCREIKDFAESMELKAENDRLNGKLRDLVMHFFDGIAAFEVSSEGLVKPLYATQNVCEFFGYTEEEWLPLAEHFTPLENFVAYSEVARENFVELLRTGEAEFSYFDCRSKTECRIKAICSEKEPNASSSRYVMLYLVDKLPERRPDDRSEARPLLCSENRVVSIRTFGYFDVFVDGTPIAFRSKKSKELFALLVDRRGGFITSEEAIGFLWEDEPATPLTLARYRKVALRLKSTLEEYGIADIMDSVDGKRRIVLDKVECDLVNYLSGKEEYSQLFKGNYLTNYSWGETTLGELINNRE